MFEPKFAFSGFSVEDLEAARRFYGEVLGLELKEAGAGVHLQLPGGARVFIYPKGADHQPATFTVLNLEVSQIDEAVTELRRRGVRFESYEFTDEQGVARGIARGQGPDIAWFKDPAGNILSVLQEPPG